MLNISIQRILSLPRPNCGEEMMMQLVKLRKARRLRESHRERRIHGSIEGQEKFAWIGAGIVFLIQMQLVQFFRLIAGVVLCSIMRAVWKLCSSREPMLLKELQRSFEWRFHQAVCSCSDSNWRLDDKLQVSLAARNSYLTYLYLHLLTHLPMFCPKSSGVDINVSAILRQPRNWSRLWGNSMASTTPEICRCGEWWYQDRAGKHCLLWYDML